MRLGALVHSIQSRYSCALTVRERHRKERHTMGQISGDKSRYNRQRRKKLARRERMRELEATAGAKPAVPPQPKGGAREQELA